MGEERKEEKNEWETVGRTLIWRYFTCVLTPYCTFVQYVFCDSKHRLCEEAEGNLQNKFAEQKVPLRHALNTLVTWTLGLAWIAWLAGKTEVDPVLKSFIPVGRLNKCYAAAGTLSVLFVLPQVLIRDSDNFCVLRGSEEVRRCCQSSKNHVVLYDWLNPLTMVGLTY